MKIAFATTLALSLLTLSTATVADDKAVDPAIYEAAVAHPDRPAGDRERDAGRKPADVLEFFGIAPGMAVLDMFSGGGYYTEIISRVVGDEGRVVAHTNQAYASFVGDETTQRYGDDRLGNVELLLAEANELELPADEFDAIMMVLAYHDIYYVDPDNGWPQIDGERLRQQLWNGLRPGGILAVVDHHALAGAPAETGNTLHRIDRQRVIDELTETGFVLDGESDVLANPEDDRSIHMGAPEIRGRTDRFVLRFRKPG